MKTERLTKKNDGTGSWTQLKDKYLPTHNIKHKQCVNKLGQLEDIEEKLGIDLITLFKAIMTKSVKWENEHGFVVELNKEELREIAKILTKEELEK